MTETRKPLTIENKSTEKKEEVVKSKRLPQAVRAKSLFLEPPIFMPRPPTPIEKEARRKGSVFQLASREIMFKPKQSSRHPEYKSVTDVMPKPQP